MEWGEKAEAAEAYVLNIQNEIMISEAQKSRQITECETKISEMSQLLNRIQSSQKKNHDLFSPFHDQEEKDEITRIKNTIDELENQLQARKHEFEQIQQKKEKEEALIECIKEFRKTLSNQKKENNVKEKIYENNIEENLGIKILETQEIERNRIARDLHDSTIQNLTSIVHKNELCMKLMDMDLIRAKLEMSVMNDNIRSIINSMRDIIYDLRPMSILDLGLTATIQNYVKTYMEQNKIQVVFHSNSEKHDIIPVVNLTLFRILQEACNNIQKYANASICKIGLMYEKDKIQLEIEDNGCGFETEQTKDICKPEHSGFGLSIMRERALLLGGCFEIHSEKNKGTKIRVSIPYQDHKGGISFGTD